MIARSCGHSGHAVANHRTPVSRLSSRLAQREESLTIAATMLTVARVIGWLPTVAIPILLVRLLSQELFGVYKQLFLVLGTAVPLLNIGLSASLFYFVPRDEESAPKFIYNAVILLSVLGVVGGAGLFAGSGFLIDHLALDVPEADRYMRLLAWLVAISVPAQVVITLPIVDKRSLFAAYILGGLSLLNGALVVVAIVVWGTLDAVLWAALLSAGLRGLALLAYLRLRMPHSRPGLPGRELFEQLRYALPFAAAALFEVGVVSFHAYYVAATTSAELFAIYAIGIVNLPFIGLLKRSIVEVVLVRLTEAHGRNDHKEVLRTWRIAASRLSILFIPLWFLGELFATELMVFVFGGEYVDSASIFRVFLLTLPLAILIDDALLRATGETLFIMKAKALGLAVSVGTVFLFASYDPLLGPIAGYVVGLGSVRALGLMRVRSVLSIRTAELFPWSEFARVVSAAAVATLVAAPVFWLASSEILRISIGTLLFLGAYFFVGLRLGILPRQEAMWVLERFAPRLSVRLIDWRR